jgi:hypothetical protein
LIDDPVTGVISTGTEQLVGVQMLVSSVPPLNV